VEVGLKDPSPNLPDLLLHHRDGMSDAPIDQNENDDAQEQKEARHPCGQSACIDPSLSHSLYRVVRILLTQVPELFELLYDLAHRLLFLLSVGGLGISLPFLEIVHFLIDQGLVALISLLDAGEGVSHRSGIDEGRGLLEVFVSTQSAKKKLTIKGIVPGKDEFSFVANLSQSVILHFVSEGVNAIVVGQGRLAGFVELANPDEGIDIDSHHQKEYGQITDYDSGKYGQSHQRVPFKIWETSLRVGSAYIRNLHHTEV